MSFTEWDVDRNVALRHYQLVVLGRQNVERAQQKTALTKAHLAETTELLAQSSQDQDHEEFIRIMKEFDERELEWSKKFEEAAVAEYQRRVLNSNVHRVWVTSQQYIA